MRMSKLVFSKLLETDLNIRTTFFIVLFTASLGALNSNAQITINQTDNFETGTVQGWGEGGSTPNAPSNIANGGPNGTGDNYL